MSYPWFIRNHSGGKHYLGPMEYQPITWQGYCISISAFILTITLIFINSFITDYLLSLLMLLVGGVIIYTGYLLIAAHFSK
jgi:hypothetical protein